MPISAICYDKQDIFFLERVNESIECNQNSQIKPQYFMHPNGIIDLTTSQEFRMASAILSLLDNLKSKNPKERLQALENLYSEVLLMGRTKFKHNTARVLIEIIKEIVRAYGNKELQLQLIHDFRLVATGKPNTVRKYLKRYYLLEMPETWNQLVFDHHVHDSNTKGRKSPTHLIMDAWVKGIRSLTVIYYNHISLEAGKELIQAAEILNIKIRIGILYNTLYRHKLLDIIWVPQAFSNVNSFISFMSQDKMKTLSEEGREVSKWKEQFVTSIVDEWNEVLRFKISKAINLEFLNINAQEFSDYVGAGQSSILHLAELIHIKNFAALSKRANEINEEIKKAQSEEKIKHLKSELSVLDKITPEYFLELFEKCEHFQDINMISKIILREEGVPQVLLENPKTLVQKLHNISSSCTITLNLSHISPEEILDLLWENKGLITHLEIFNVNDWHKGKLNHLTEINGLLQAINNENSPNLKQVIQSIIEKCRKEDSAKNSIFSTLPSYAPDQNKSNSLNKTNSGNHEKNMGNGEEVSKNLKEKIINHETEKLIEIEQQAEKAVEDLAHNIKIMENENLSAESIADIRKIIDLDSFTCRCCNMADYKHDKNFILISKEQRMEKLTLILQNIAPLIEFYKNKKLYTRMGTDSTSRVGWLAGMGLAYPMTLPRRARNELRKRKNISRLRLPVRKEIKKVVTYNMPYANEYISPSTRLLRCIPFIKNFTYKKSTNWTDFDPNTFVHEDGSCSSDTRDFSSNKGNIVTLGGVGLPACNNFVKNNVTEKNKFKYSNLNTNIKNCLKLLIGFIPAFLSFNYTQNIEFLAWFGAIIWFAITGFRNIIQAVVAGGGLQRSPLLRWNNYVNWTRLCDSLMYTGISVVILELLVRNILLSQQFNITSTNSPLIAFTVISVINGLYIVFHNIIRGLQPEAIYGNFFRSFLAIPIALLYNNVFSFLLSSFGVLDTTIILQSSSAILSKLASDTIAGVIEGSADKSSFIWLRQWDYKIATKVMYKNYGQLELEFPKQDAIELLENPEETLAILKEKNHTLYTNLILNSLDFMTFYYYQPRAYSTLKSTLTQLSDIERLAVLRLLSVLKSQKDVSQLFIDGLFGDNFSKALAFYLEKHEHYLENMAKLYKTRIEEGNQ